MTDAEFARFTNEGHRLATGSYRIMQAARLEFPDMTLVPVRTSIGKPRFQLGYDLVEFNGTIAPYGVFGKKAAEQEEGYRQLYLARLRSKGHAHVGARLKEIANRYGPGATLVLLCFEDLSPKGMQKVPDNFCHRRMFADWFAECIGEPIPELDEMIGLPADTSKGAQDKLF